MAKIKNRNMQEAHGRGREHLCVILCSWTTWAVFYDISSAGSIPDLLVQQEPQGNVSNKEKPLSTVRLCGPDSFIIITHFIRTENSQEKTAQLVSHLVIIQKEGNL